MQGQLARAGAGRKGTRAAQAMLVAMPMTVIAQKPSLPPFSSAFQEACSNAANRTRRAMERVIHSPLRPRADITLPLVDAWQVR